MSARERERGELPPPIWPLPGPSSGRGLLVLAILILILLLLLILLLPSEISFPVRSDPNAASNLTGPIALLTGTLPVPDMHFDQCSCGVLQVLHVQALSSSPRVPSLMLRRKSPKGGAMHPKS